MRQIFMMIPLLEMDNDVQMKDEVSKILNISEQNFIIRPLNESQICIQVKNFNLTFQEITTIIKNYQQNEIRIQILQDVLYNYKIPKYQIIDNTKNMQLLISKAKKYQEIKEQNKKLRKMLQIQLDNTQRVREETQKTMKILKEQFEALVGQMNHNNNNNNNNHIQNNHGQINNNYRQIYQQKNMKYQFKNIS